MLVPLCLVIGWMGIAAGVVNDDQQNDVSDCPFDGMDWTLYRPEDLTLPQIIDYIEWPNASSCELAHAIGGVLIHGEGVKGQKTVCLDWAVRPESGDCLVYSFREGKNNESTFDKDMETFGCEVHVFDPAADSSHYGNRSKYLHVHRFTLDDVKSSAHQTLDSIYKLLKHTDRIVDYLNLDINKAEWAVLPQMIQSGAVDRVRQIGVQVHLPVDKGLDELRSNVRILKSLEVYGFIRLDSRYVLQSVDWNGVIDYEGPTAYELVWYNGKLIRPQEAPTVLEY